MMDLAARTRQAYDNARNAPREGSDTGRGPGNAGRIADEWMRLAEECAAGGIDWRTGLPLPDAAANTTRSCRAALTLSSDELRQVREALTECSDDLAAYVEHEYPKRFRDSVPSEDRRYRRDIEPVNRARAALSILASKEPKA